MLVRFWLLVWVGMGLVSLSCSQMPIAKETEVKADEPSPTTPEPTPTDEQVNRTLRFRKRFYGDVDKFTKESPPFFEGISKAQSVTLYEGLPHQLWEMELLEKELKEKKTVKFNKFPFYQTPIPITKEVARKLQALCSDVNNFKPYQGPKFCGGYHPDWCIEFKYGDKAIQVQVCFGCHEAAFNESEKHLMTDMNESVLKELGKILHPLQTNRPEEKVKPKDE